MDTHLGSVRLRTGEAMDVRRITGPEPGRAAQVLALLHHKSPLYLEPAALALETGLPGLGAHFYVGDLGDELAANVTIHDTFPEAVGILMHVYTAPEQRRKGIARALMEAAVGDFRERGGRVLYLNTEYDSSPFRIYQRAGFEPVGRRGDMRWQSSPDAEERFFAGDGGEVVELDWGDWPLLEALYFSDGGWEVRSLYYEQWGVCGAEGEFPALRRALGTRAIATEKALKTASGAIIGHGFVANLDAAGSRSRSRPIDRLRHSWSKIRYLAQGRGRATRWRLIYRAWRLAQLLPGRGFVLDFFVHPAFEAHTGRLLGALGPLPGPIYAAAEPEAIGKVDALRTLGFQEHRRFRRVLPTESGPRSVHLYRRDG